METQGKARGRLGRELLPKVVPGEPVEISPTESKRLLDLYDRQRRAVAVEFVQEQSIANKKRLEAADPEQRRRNLDELRSTAADPARARAFLLRTSMIVPFEPV